jgi:hypothetical protein
MPTALHPQAKFDPIPPDLDLHALVDSSPNFDWVVRISTSQIRRLGTEGFEKLVQLHVIEGGRPLVIEGWSRVLPESLFSAKWLEETYNKKRKCFAFYELLQTSRLNQGQRRMSVTSWLNQIFP